MASAAASSSRTTALPSADYPGLRTATGLFLPAVWNGRTRKAGHVHSRCSHQLGHTGPRNCLVKRVRDYRLCLVHPYDHPHPPRRQGALQAHGAWRMHLAVLQPHLGNLDAG